MRAGVEKCVNNGDMTGLHYIFLDSLDVDPTFEKYRDDYEYCKNNLEGFFETHQEMFALSQDRSQWTNAYWTQMKRDLGRNFSQKRFEHMMEVAKIVFAEKVERLRRERSEKQEEEKISLTVFQNEEKTADNTKTNDDSNFEEMLKKSLSPETDKKNSAASNGDSSKKELGTVVISVVVTAIVVLTVVLLIQLL